MKEVAKKYDLLKDEVITVDNVERRGIAIALRALKLVLSHSYNRRLDKLYFGLVKDMENINNPDHIFSDGYDLAQEASCFLCAYMGKSIYDKCAYDVKGRSTTILKACFSRINVLGKKSVSKKDIKTLFFLTPSMKIDVDATIKYCLAFSWICGSRGFSISEDLLNYLDDEELLNSKIIDSTVRKLFDEGYLNELCFSFNLAGEGFQFRNELFPLEFSAIRDVLVDQGFFVTKRTNHITYFYVARKYEKILASFLKDSRIKLTLEDLKKKLVAEALVGEKAEKFALAFEKARLNKVLAERVQLISEIDVSAGYDIISFLDDFSTNYDCYIEVKAISHDFDFYWSKNEYEIAKLHGDHYKLYLVDLSKIANEAYKPFIISNPAQAVMESNDWLIEPQSFHIKKVL